MASSCDAHIFMTTDLQTICLSVALSAFLPVAVASGTLLKMGSGVTRNVPCLIAQGATLLHYGRHPQTGAITDRHIQIA
jgi:hypothetical protein